MKLFAAALALTVAFTGLVAPSTADACAMKVRLPDIEMVADNHFKKGVRAEEQGQARAAIRHFERAMNADGSKATRADAALRAARLHQSLGRTERAIARMTRGVAINGEHFDLRLALGRALVQKDAAGAIAQLEAARDLDRLSAEVYPELAIAHARLGQREEAQRYLTTAKGLGAAPERVIAAEKALAGVAGVAVL